VLATLA